MRILVLNYEYPPLGGGGGVIAAHLAEALAADHELSVVTSGTGDLPSHEVRNGVEIHRVRVPGRKDRDAATMISLLGYPGAAARKAGELIQHRRFDLVHSHFAVPTGPGSMPAARRAALPHVQSVHGGDLYDPSKWTSPHRHRLLRMVVNRVLNGSDAVVASSTNVRDMVHRYYRCPGPVEIIPLGIPIRDIDAPTVSRRAAGADGPLQLVTVGRLVRRKALDVLLRALARPECHRTVLTVVGGGPELGALEALARDLDLTERVTFAGHVDEDDKWRILAQADAYVSSAMHEGFGIVFLEAMAARLPIVCFDHGGQIDFLRNGETGFVAPAGDVDGMSTAIGRIAREPELAIRMGADNRRRVDGFRIELCGTAYEALFRRILKRRAESDVSRPLE